MRTRVGFSLNTPKSMSHSTMDDVTFQARIVRMIAVERKPEEALEALCARYRIERPALKVGLPKGEKRALGCYVHRDRTIYMSSEEYLFDPYVLIHEFYHHLRHVGGKHRGTERHARDFAVSFLKSAQNVGQVST